MSVITSIPHLAISQLYRSLRKSLVSIAALLYDKINYLNLILSSFRAQRVQSVIDHAPEQFADPGMQHSQWWGNDIYDGN